MPFHLQEIQVNYTIATGSEPDVKLASTNCHNSHVLLRNYELDTTGQADRDELELVRSDMEMYASLIAFTKNLINSQAMVTTDSAGKATLLSPKPSPPPPPPPVPELEVYAPVHPPAPPELVSGSVLVTRYEEALIDSEAREGEIVLKLAECFVKDRADDTVCGFSSNEAPHPWMAKNNVKCRGYDTLQARQEDYCGYCKTFATQTNTPCSAELALSRASILVYTTRHILCRAGESDVNPLAADRKLRKELLEVGPYCIDENDEVAYCSPNATRTQRSGVTDIEYMSRPDREYWPVCLNSNHTHAHSRTQHQIDPALNPTQRVQVCADAAHARGGQ